MKKFSNGHSLQKIKYIFSYGLINVKSWIGRTGLTRLKNKRQEQVTRAKNK